MSKRSPLRILIIFIEILTILFIVLKLIDFINLSWLWILSPIWISIILMFMSLTATVIENRTGRLTDMRLK